MAEPIAEPAPRHAAPLASIVRPSVAVVIGASGGIGAALAARVAEAGFIRTFAFARSASAVAGTVAGSIDLTDEAGIAAAAATAGACGPVGLVIVATGLLHDARQAPEKSYRAITPDAMARAFAVNATGPALVAKHFLPLFPKRGRAVFAALSARVGSIGDNRSGGWHGYRASKAALNMLVVNLALELERTHPDAVVAGLHPGTVDTGLSKPFQRGVTAGKLFSAAQSADYLLGVLANLTPADSGGCFAWDGTRIKP